MAVSGLFIFLCSKWKRKDKGVCRVNAAEWLMRKILGLRARFLERLGQVQSWWLPKFLGLSECVLRSRDYNFICQLGSATWKLWGFFLGSEPVGIFLFFLFGGKCFGSSSSCLLICCVTCWGTFIASCHLIVPCYLYVRVINFWLNW